MAHFKRNAVAFLVLVVLAGCRQPWDGFKDQLAAVKSPDAATRAHAASFLGSIGPEAKICLPALEDALKDKNPLVRVEAANAIWRIDPEIKRLAVPMLSDAAGAGMIWGDASLAKNLSIKYLGEIGPEAKEAIPNLKLCLKSESRYERVIAATAMIQIDKTTREIALPVLSYGLRKDQDQFTKVEAADALCKLGRDAKEFMPAVRKLLEDDDTFVRGRVARALEGMAKE